MIYNYFVYIYTKLHILYFNCMINCMILYSFFRILIAILPSFCIYLLHSSPLNFKRTTVESLF